MLVFERERPSEKQNSLLPCKSDFCGPLVNQTDKSIYVTDPIYG